MIRPEQVLISFLGRNLDPARPILLGFSGGPDSLALFHCLLIYRQSYALDLRIVHIDHGWRPESGEEALILEKLAKSNQLPFYLKKISPKEIKGNLEAGCRQERLDFFCQIAKECDAQAVLLAHHADDQAETVLKRVLEGSSLPNLSGLQEKTSIGGLEFWRPFLHIPKKVITGWLELNNRIPFDDKTNLDPKFLRGKFRTVILPRLAEDFGKEIQTGLSRIGDEAAELRHYLDDVTNPYLSRIIKGPLGTFLDFSTSCPEHRFELKYILRKFCEYVEVVPSREIIDQATEFIILGHANKQFRLGRFTLFIDRKHLVMIKQLITLPSINQALVIGTGKFGPWKIEVVPALRHEIAQQLGWQQAWKGEIESIIPEGEYQLGASIPNASYQNRKHTIGEWWTDHKVPVYLRSQVPVLWKDRVVQYEFLSGKNPKAAEDEKKWWKIRLTQI